MTAKDINVAIKWEDINGNLITSDYGTISALNVKIVNYTEGLSALAPGSEVLEMVPCDEYNFSPDPDVLAKVKDHLCMSNTTSFELSGDDYSERFKFLEFSILPCFGTDWKSQIEQTIKVNHSRASVYVASSYFDFKNIEQPVQKFYRFYSNIIFPNTFAEAYFQIQPNEYTLDDSIFDKGSQKTGRLYTNDKFYTGINTDSFASHYLKIIVKLDTEYQKYERSLLSIIEVFGIVGGSYEIISLVFRLILPIFTQRIFKHSIVKKLTEKPNLLWEASK